MYVNKGMSTIKIADELNRREILPPAMYLKIPTYMKKQSSNPGGKYIWLRAQVGKILRNEVYLGSVVGRKFQKISHKVAKVRCTKKEEHIVLENMHEAIIDIQTWNMAQDKLNKNSQNRDRKYDHILKGIVYCGECGNKAILKCREEKRKNGSIWRANYFICSKRNSYRELCNCKQISADLIEKQVEEKLRKEFEKVKISDDDIKQIYEQAEKETSSESCLLYKRLKDLKFSVKKIENSIEEIYQDKINKIIEMEDFKIIYEKKIKEKEQIIKEIENVKRTINKDEKNNMKINFEKAKKIAIEFLNMKNPNKIIMEKLIERIEFDKEKNIKIQLKFQDYNIK